MNLRRLLQAGAGLHALSMLVGCGGAATSYVKSDTTLGKIVVYRNGVAYFERSATVEGDTLRLAAPPDKVDDFLKSLTVVDANTGEPAPISYPSTAGGDLELKINLPGKGPHQVKLSYVTEAPAWKPSYRIMIPKNGKLAMQAWAVVDNTSGEDWQNVTLGVGSSSAMSFRFNLRGIRTVDRQTLRAEDLFAMAPPTGGATFGAAKDRAFDFTDDALTQNEVAQNIRDEKKSAGNKVDAQGSMAQNYPRAAPAPVSRAAGAGIGSSGTGMGKGSPGMPSQAMPAPPPTPPVSSAFSSAAEQLRRTQNMIVVEGYATPTDGDKHGASLERANKLREQLIREGVDPGKVVAIGKGEQQGRAGGARVLEQAPPQVQKPATEADANAAQKAQAAGSGEPIGTSHFESKTAMTVPKGSSAMVSIFKGETEGEVVYLFDAESPRGNGQFPFRAVRFQNPTDSQLEQGPVSVFGDGRFIGEGMAEPIPARTNAFVPFALDRQVVVEHKDTSKDEIARIITVQRGVFSTEVKHTKKIVYTLNNRSAEKAVVYVKHTVPQGFVLSPKAKVAEKIGNASLLRVEVPPSGKAELEIEESTPVFKSTDIRTTDGLGLLQAYVSAGALEGSPELRAQITQLVTLQKDMVNLEQRIQTQREQMAEYRARMDELHAQLVTLKLVKTAGPMMSSLEKKMQEVSDKVSKATVNIVDSQEKLMLSKIKFQDGVAELSLEKKPETKEVKAAAK
jgi:hypothetical protein